jgi:hypothetical protein
MNDSVVGVTSHLLFPFMTWIFHLLIVMLVLQVDPISETTALGQEAYILFYVRQGMFPWFSNMQEQATPRRKVMYSPNENNVFAFENLGKD